MEYDRRSPRRELPERRAGVEAAIALTTAAVRDADAEAADRVSAMRGAVAHQANALLERQAQRLRPDDPDYLSLARLQMSIVDKLTRSYELAARIARSILPTPASQGPA